MTAVAAPVPPAAPTPQRWLASRSKLALLISGLIGLCIFTLLASVTNVPAEPGHAPSLLLQTSPIMALLVTAVGLAVSALLLSALQGSDDPTDALFGAAVGLAALAWRGGTMTALLQNSSSAAMVGLICETILLAAGLYGCYEMLVRRRQARLGPAQRHPLQPDVEWNDLLLGLAVAAGVCAVVIFLLAPTDAKKQVMAAVAVGGFAGAAAGYSFIGLESPLAYAAAPLLVGIVGYLLVLFNPGPGLHIGVTNQPLAYPLPLEYASLGVGGALVGYWSAQGWKQEA